MNCRSCAAVGVAEASCQQCTGDRQPPKARTRGQASGPSHVFVEGVQNAFDRTDATGVCLHIGVGQDDLQVLESSLNLISATLHQRRTGAARQVLVDTAPEVLGKVSAFRRRRDPRAKRATRQ